jgi:ABC-type multidrug transport system fused ATPase/permease subunit
LRCHEGTSTSFTLVHLSPAIFCFLATTLTHPQAQTDLQHLWCGRRASTRIRVELIAAVYDKALKRKDFSGLVDRDKVREAAERKAGDKPQPKTKAQKQAAAQRAEKADDPKAGADTGKIVNLMASDQTRVSTIVSGAYNIYGAPMEIIVGSTFLYALLGCVFPSVSSFSIIIVIVVLVAMRLTERNERTGGARSRALWCCSWVGR